jgi:hypothetical protein
MQVSVEVHLLWPQAHDRMMRRHILVVGEVYLVFVIRVRSVGMYSSCFGPQ